MSEGQIIGIEWRSSAKTVGFVAVQYEDYWCAYVGPTQEVHIPELGITLTKEALDDAVWIKHHGAKLSKKEALVFFPQFSGNTYKGE